MKKNLIRSALTLLTVFTLLGPFSLNGLQYVAAEGENLTITVTKSDGVTPVSWAWCSVYNSTYTYYQSGSTDINGQVSMTLPAAGTYSVSVYAWDADEVNPEPTSFAYSVSPVELNISLTLPAVRGKVLKPGGLPAESANIQLRSSDYSYFASGVTTDSNGLFRIGSNTLNGTYYLDISPGWSDTGILTSTGIPITVTAGSTNSNYVTSPIQLEAALKTISGTVSKPDGTEITDASVNAFTIDGGYGYGYDQTDANGQYSILVGRGKYQVMISPIWQQGESPDWGYFDPPKNVNFTQSNSVAESQTVNFEVVEFTSTIHGRVLNPDGSTPEPMDVNINAWSAGGFGGNMNDSLDANGYFDLLVAPNATYQINLWVNNNTYGAPSVPSVSVGDGVTVNIGTIRLVEKNSVISGTVRDANGVALSNQSVNAWQMNGSGWGGAQSDENGQYSLYLTAGTWFVDAYPMPPQPGMQNQTTYVKTQAPQRVTVAENETVDNVDIEFAIADAKINGTVQDPEGNTLETLNSYVYANDVNRAIGEGGTMMGYGNLGGMVQNGAFSIDVPEGTYRLGVFMPAGSEYTPASEEEITVGSGETYDGAIISLLPNNAVISGSLVGRNGDPIDDVWGEVFADNGQGGYQWSQFEDGSYSLNVSAGEWRLGYWVDPTSGYLSSFGQDLTVTAVAEETVTQDITLLKADSVIQGQVRDPEGNPLPNAWVSVDTELGGRRTTEEMYFGPMFNQGNISDANGNFSISVPQGTYFVSASLPFDQGYIYPRAQQVTVDPDNPAEVTLQFRQADGQIVGTVTLDGEPVAYAYVNGWSEDGAFSQTDTDSDGEYTLDVIKDETWHVSATYETATKFYRSNEHNVNIAKAKRYRIQIDASGVARQDLILYESDITISPAETASFDSTQPKIMQLLDGTKIDMPAYSLATSGTVTVTATPRGQGVPTTAVARPIALAYDLSVKDSQNQEITSFQSNITITIPYTHAQLEALGIGEDDISPKYYDETTGTWKAVANVVVNSEDDIVSFTVDHVTNFAIVTGNIVEQGESGGPDVSIDTPTEGEVIPSLPLTVSGEVSDPEAEVNIVLENDNEVAATVEADGQYSAILNNLQFGENVISVCGDNGIVTCAEVTVHYRPMSGGQALVTMPETGGPQVRVFDADGQVTESFFAYNESLRGKFNVLTADITGDGVDEIITYPGAGFTPHLRVFNLDGTFLTQVFVYQETFRGGPSVTAGDVTGDNIADLVITPQTKGSPNVRIYSYDAASEELELVDWFMAYQEEFRGHLNVALGDLDGNTGSEIVLAPAELGGPNVRAYHYNSETEAFDLIDWFMAYDENFKGGVNLTVSNVLGDERAEIVVAPVAQGGPNIRVYQYDQTSRELALVDWFMAYEETYKGGVNLAAADLNADGLAEIVTSPTVGGPNVRAYHYNSETEVFDLVDWFMAYDENFRSGVMVKAAYLDNDNYADLIVTPRNSGGPNLRVYEFDAETAKLDLVDWLMVYDENFAGRLVVVTADTDDDPQTEIVVSPLNLGGPNVRVLNLESGSLETADWFMAYAETFKGGVRVSPADNPAD